ncbi:hypothetical protein [Glutamicibacter sp. V16R2B1]|uniref:hypothetical protein n=1 Tax=Glutamicibacter sp. V16R2B1 TaxID=2036207 RepID=UPI0010FE63B1|nr:hypothetical protein [Glutamicibacter sp. V16R2B1]MCK9901335.1 hypothetical protein [Frankia sp. Cpl3]TLK47813.1 hypothetical protein FDN03_15635 [Glutamicibacter sp. V16R2B1]
MSEIAFDGLRTRYGKDTTRIDPQQARADVLALLAAVDFADRALHRIEVGGAASPAEARTALNRWKNHENYGRLAGFDDHHVIATVARGDMRGENH